MKACKLFSVVVAAASTLFVALSARAEYTCELSFPSAPATALANFPVLVRLAENAPTGFHYADCPTASCIWFTDENDDAIPCDVDTWDTTSNSLVWVSVPSLSDAATITMHWDVGGAPAGQPASSNVWSSAGYVGVWHMNELLVDGTGTYTPDSSGKGWNAYKANEADGYPVTISDAGNATSAPPTGHAMVNQLGGNRDIGGFLVPASATSGTTIGPFTVSFFEESVNTGNDRAFALGGTATGGNRWNNGNVTAGKTTTYIMNANNGGYGNFTYSDGLADNAWRHIAGVFDSTPAGYVGGVSKTLQINSTWKPESVSKTLSHGIGLGTYADHGETFTGYLDEMRLRNAASTGEWIAEEYKTVTTANYVSFGPVESGSGSVEVLRLGTPTVSDITAVSATVSGRLTKFGEGATSASVSLHYTDGGAATNTVALGSTNAVPAEFTADLANLTPSTAYTVWFSAVNNAETPASTNSVATVFSTGADATEWDTATATFTPDGRTITATVDITNVGSGTSTLYLLTGSSAAAATTVSGSVPVTSAGTKTVTADLSDKPWGSRVYYSLMLVNGTEANAVTNTYAPSGNAAYKDLQDNSTYTWIGGASGVWNDPTQWNRTTAGNLAATDFAGYPVYGSTAIFATAVGDDPVMVTVPATTGTSIADNSACWFVSMLNLANMHMPLTFISDSTEWTSRIHIPSLAALTGLEKQKNYIRLVFDHCAAYFAGQRFLGDTAVDENGENFTITFTRGAVASVSNWTFERPGAKLRVEKDAIVSAGQVIGGWGNLDDPPNVIEVEDATFQMVSNNDLKPDNNGDNGMVVRLMGHHPKYIGGNVATQKATGTSIVEFVVPAGGYTEPPLHIFMDNVLNKNGKSPLTLRIATNSPALFAGVATTTRFVNAKVADGATEPQVVFDLPTGVTTSTFTDPNGNADGYVVSIPAGAGPALANVGIASCKDNSFTIAGTLSIVTANESATITSYVAEDGGDFAAKGTTTSGGGPFSVKASGLVAGTKYRWYVEAVTPSGSFRTVEQVLTFYPGAAAVSDASVAPIKVDGEKVYVFTDSETPGSITFAKGGLVEVLVVGGGGAGGTAYGGGGGAGAFLHRRDFIPAGTYDVTVGKGGYNEVRNYQVPSIPAEASSIGNIFVAQGGGAGGPWNNPGTSGGSGGGSAKNINVEVCHGVWPFGTDGGGSYTGNPGSGGGGAGGPGGDLHSWGGVKRGGYGGDGIVCSITGESKTYAAGGGGGAGSASGQLPGSAGFGGVPGTAASDAAPQDAAANTGSGGGGGGSANNDSQRGGSGGSGIVVIRVKKFGSVGLSIIVR